jgi:hypothetical protein
MNKEQLKFTGGALIVLAAGAMMFNQLFSYVAGIGRMISMIVTALLIAWLITFVMVRLKGKNKGPGPNPKDSSNANNGQKSSNTQYDAETEAVKKDDGDLDNV